MKAIKLISKENIFIPGNKSYKNVHASTLEYLSDGTICAAWFGGTKEKNPDVEIWFSQRDKIGSWSEPEMISIKDNIPKWNPVLFFNDNRLFIFYKKGMTIPEWKTYYRVSDDMGKSLSAPEILVKGNTGGRGPVKNKPVKLSDGTILAGASTEDAYGRWEIFIDKSEDNCITWRRTAPLKFKIPGDEKIYNSKEELKPDTNGLIQPAIWEHPEHNGRVSLFARSSFGCIYRADSADFGETWSAAYPTEIPNNNSGMDAVMTEAGILALVYNKNKENWGKRTPLNLALFDAAYENIETEIEIENKEGEFSYPAVISRGNRLFITYTNDRKTISFAEYEIINI